MRRKLDLVKFQRQSIVMFVEISYLLFHSGVCVLRGSEFLLSSHISLAVGVEKASSIEMRRKVTN
jgi:hypothetical protein